MKTLITLTAIGAAALLSNNIIGVITLAVVCFVTIVYLGSKAIDEPLQAIETEEE